MKKYFLKTFIILILFLLAKPVMAADLYFESNFDLNNLNLEESFQLDLLIDTKGKNINAIETKIFFPSSLELIDIKDSASIINFWISKEKNNNEVYLAGIIPGGFEGILKPYDNRKYPGNIISLILKTKKSSQGTIDLRDTQVLLNDGKGSEVPLNISNISFLVAEEEYFGTISGEAKKAEDLDYDPPEYFTPIVSQDANIFSGQWFVSFNTQDKGSGLKAYYVFESLIEKETIDKNDWQEASSPYLLKDQKLESYIYIKAVDRAGNERVVFVPPSNIEKSSFNYLYYTFPLLLLLVIYISFKFLWTKKEKKN